ncbi:hypothetical protein D9M71_696230 [compost metagenome]
MRALLDTGRGVADDVVEGLLQLFHDLADAFLGEGVLVTGLAGGQHVEVFEALVLDQGLGQGGFAVDYVDEVVNHTAFTAHDQVEVSQTDVEVDDGGLETAQCQAGAEGGACGGFTDATLTGSDYEDLGQGDSPQ